MIVLICMVSRGLREREGRGGVTQRDVSASRTAIDDENPSGLFGARAAPDLKTDPF